MATRSFIVTPEGTLERMPVPISISGNKAGKDEHVTDMKIIVPKVASDLFRQKLQVSAKYIQNNQANSLNLRDYVESRTVSTRSRDSAHDTAKGYSYHLKAWN